MKFTIIAIILLTLVFNPVVFAQGDKDIKREDKVSTFNAMNYFDATMAKVEKALSPVDVLTGPIKSKLRDNNIDLNFFAGALQGYDNNVNLDPDRKKDTFTDISLNTEVFYNYTPDIRLKVENDSTGIIYYNVTSADLVDIDTRAGLEVDLMDDRFTLGGDCAFDYVLFPNDKDGTYMGYELSGFLKNYMTPTIYHRIRYKWLLKYYSHDKTINGSKKRTDENRQDDRNAVDYEIGWYIQDRFILKTNFELYYNNSNYQYFDYYDYWSFRLRPSIIFMITKKLSTSGSITYQRRNYNDRLSTENDTHVKDNTLSFNVSLLYDISRSFTVAINYSYRENYSNEPLQRYSGSMATAGVYYSF